MDPLTLKLIKRKSVFWDLPEYVYIVIVIIIQTISIFLIIHFDFNRYIYLLSSVALSIILIYLVKKRYGLFVKNYEINGTITFIDEGFVINYIKLNQKSQKITINKKSIKIFSDAFQNYISGRGDLSHTGINRIVIENDSIDIFFLLENKSQLNRFKDILVLWYKYAKDLIERYKDNNGCRLLLFNPNYKYEDLERLKKMYSA